MTRGKKPLRNVRWAVLFVFVAIGLLAPSLSRAQSSGPYVDACVYNGVDWTNDVEQETCLYGDSSELDASADVDSWAYEDSSNWPSGDLYVVGLGAQGQLYDNENHLVVDTGMIDNGPYGSMVQSELQLPDGYAFTSITPQTNIWYTLNGFYSECYDYSGTGSDSCSWNGPTAGLSTQAMITSSSLQPTLILSASSTPTVYQNPVTFTVSLSNEPDQGGVNFYDGSTLIGGGFYNGSNSPSFTTSSLAAGTHSITAVWPGDYETNSATSNVVTQVVNPITYDSGNVSLTIGATTETASFGQGSTPASIAQSLASAFSGDSQVSVNAFGNVLTMTATQTGSPGDYSFMASDSYNSGIFSSSSFYPSSTSGYLSGGSTGGQVPLYTFSGSYDTNGNVVGYADSVMGSWSFGYDQLNRLVTAANTALPLPTMAMLPSPTWGQNLCWAYDAFGNRLQQTASNLPITASNGACNFAPSGTNLQNVWASYNAQNQMTQTSAPGWTDTPTYDAAGDVSNDGNNTYLYDAEGRICAVQTLYGTWGYLYDAAGNRVAKGSITSFSCNFANNDFTQTKGYVVDGAGQQLTEVDGSNNWTHSNVWANGKLIGTYDTAGLHFHFDDPLGTRRAQANAAGVLEAVYQSLPYGDGLNSAAGSQTLDVRFTNDSCSGCVGPPVGGGDRNLYVNSITVGSTAISQSDPAVFFTAAPCNAYYGSQATLLCNGDMEDSNLPAGSPISVNAWGSPDYSIYPDMQVYVDGTLEGDWTVTSNAQNYTVTAPPFDSSDPTENHFTGKERDTESGNDYMFARYYNSATGRFLSPDWDAKSDDPVPYAKLDNPQSLNLYSYVGNNPAGKADPDGHDPTDALKLEGLLEVACPECTPIIAAAAIVTVGVIAVKAYEEHQDASPAAPVAPAAATTKGEKAAPGPPKAATAPGVTAGNQATDRFGNKVGPSGENQVNEVDHSGKKRAAEAARRGGKGKPEKHTSPVKGGPHFHPTDKDGEKIPNSTHHNYPD